MTTTSTSIAEQLQGLASHVERLQERADALALDAVADKGDARAQLATILADIEQADREAPTLRRAYDQALQREAEATKEADTAARAQHMDDARETASRIVEAAAKGDALIAEFVALLSSIDADEKAAHRSLRAAGEPLVAGQHGRHGGAALVAERMSAAASFKLGRLSDQRDLSTILSAAWSDLTEATTND